MHRGADIRPRLVAATRALRDPAIRAEDIAARVEPRAAARRTAIQVGDRTEEAVHRMAAAATRIDFIPGALIIHTPGPCLFRALALFFCLEFSRMVESQ